MSNAASIRGPRRIRPQAIEPSSVASAPPPLPSRMPPPLPSQMPSQMPRVVTPAAFAPTLRASPPPPLPAQSLVTQGSRTAGHAPVRINVRPDAPVPQMSAMTERALGTTVRVRRTASRDAEPHAWRPFRGFIVGASLGAAIMMVFTASGSDRVRDMRAWVASSLREMKSDGAAHVEAPAPAPGMVIPVVVDMAGSPKGAAAPTPAPAACATPRAATATPIANTIPTLDVMQLPKAKPLRAWKPSKRAVAAPRVEAPAPDESESARAGDEA